ncbi:hypothetical protein [Clostridium sardiniense]|uniref:hypothetical protein n=1 Tax=Clostridium sardiniense TaxID=29369 RepID=UPI003D352AA5
MKKKTLTLIIGGLAVVIVLTAGTLGYKYKEYKKYLVLSRQAIDNKKYDEALKDLQSAANIYDKNSDIKLLQNIILTYEKANESYNRKDYNEAKKYIDEIPKEYEEYPIKQDIDDLKNNIDKAQECIETVSKDIEKNKEILKSEEFKEGKKDLIKIDTTYATEDQKKEIDNITVEGNKIREEQKKKEEAIKIQKEKELKEQEAKEKAEKAKADAKVNSMNNNFAVTNIHSQDATQGGPIHVVSSKLGIQFDLPAKYRGKYRVEYVDDGMIIYYNKAREGGILVKIYKGDQRDCIDGGTVSVGGKVFTVGGPMDFNISEDDPNVNEFESLSRGAIGPSKVSETIRPYNG